MADQLFGLTEEDLRWVKDNILTIRDTLGIGNRSRPPQDHQYVEGADHQAPEVYIAYPWDSYTTGTGTGTDATLPALTDVGTATGYDIPGMAKCVIYKVIMDQFGSPTLRPLGGGTPEEYFKWVFNVTTSDLAAQYFPVTKDKFGRWLAVAGGGGAAKHIRFEVDAAGPFLGDVGIECDYVVATVLGNSCSTSSPAVGSEVNVWDPSMCHFNLPIEILIGVHGMAVEMVNVLEGVDCIDERAAEGACRWVVQGLCCTEELYGG